ncbi:MAG: polyhydroxyalkanoate synthesis regulator DNA-binding domain-containing protein [Phycisphaerae bacterium]
MATQADDTRTLRIRKYPNRRYYDTTRSRHVTLEEIHSLIREGYDVQVTDSRSGEDITGKILTQIIVELDSPKLGVFPVPLLHKLLRSSEKIVTDFVQKYFNEALDSFLDSQRNMEHLMRSAMGLPTGGPMVADVTKMFWSPLKSVPWGAPPPQQAAPATPPAAPSVPAEEELRATITKLQEEIAELRRAAKPPRARARKKK